MLAVVVVHSWHSLPVRWGGSVGVALFFTLSGFLITRLMLDERASTGQVLISGFYARRARRLLPPLVPVLGVCAVVNWRLGYAILGPLESAVTYRASYTMTDGSAGAFRHLWSLAVEEHFYVVWPLIVAVAARVHVRRWAIGVIVLVGLARAVVAFSDPEYAYRATHLRVDGMLLGALLAFAGPMLVRRAWTIGAWLVLACMTLTAIPPAVAQGWGLTVAGLAAVVVVAAAVDARPPEWLRHLGVISYGVYLYHYPVIRLLGTSIEDGPRLFGAALLMTLLCAEVSYRFLETPIRMTLRSGRPDLQKLHPTVAAIGVTHPQCARCDPVRQLPGVAVAGS